MSKLIDRLAEMTLRALILDIAQYFHNIFVDSVLGAEGPGAALARAFRVSGASDPLR